MPSVNVDGVSLEYAETGTGDAVVMVHGAISDHRIWDAQREAFGKQYRAIALSLRYHWPNAPMTPDDFMSYTQHADDVAGLITTLHAGPAHLVGNSSGGLICLYLAVRHPEVVRSLTLLEPFIMAMLVSMPPDPAEVQALAAHHPDTAEAIARFGAEYFGPALEAYGRGDAEAALQTFSEGVLGPWGINRMTETQLAYARDNNFPGQFAADMPRLDPTAVRGLRMPTLLVTGHESPKIFHLFTDRLVEHIPHAGRVDIPNASHTPQVDNPAAVNDAILAFLAKHADPR